MNIQDEEVKKLMEEIEGMDGNELASNYGFPEAPKKDSIYKFFREILKKTDSSKVGNLDKKELGYLTNTVRDYQHIASYAKEMELLEVSNYLKGLGEVILSTSMSKKGFLAQLFVTQIKKEQKVKDEPKEQTGWFKSKFGGGNTEQNE